MTRLTLSLLLLLFAPAYAAGPDDLLDDEDEEDVRARREAEKRRLQDADKLDKVDDSDADKIKGVNTGEDLLGGERPQDRISTEGQDNSRIYREASEDYANLTPDEEMLAWERYLQRYPNSIYKDRIARHLEDLEAQLYRERKQPGTEKRLDADQREVPISQGLLIENINPTTRIQSGFEWGIPDYINLMADYEHGITREFSVHGGLRNRFQIWNLETGVKYALVKSSRTSTLVTALADVRLAFNPAFVAFRPQLAAGKMIGPIDIQIQGGVDLEARKASAVRLVGGMNVTGRIDDNVAVFVETNYNAKNVLWDRGGAFQFPVASFGIKLYPVVGDRPPGFMEVNIGASLPYATRYYRWHEGSIMGQVNFYL
jgi:hypothetical protein